MQFDTACQNKNKHAIGHLHMQTMIKKKIALVIKTAGLDYDDRVRKEILSVQKLFSNIKFKIFVMYPENKETTGVTSYGTPYKSVYIPSRDKYPSGHKAALKSYEFYKVIKNELKEFDAVWCANDDTALVVALVKTKHLLWDLHELPSTLMGNPLKKLLLRYLFARCKVVVHANPQREQYLESIGAISNPFKHFALRNYPNFEDRDNEYDEKYQQFMKWKGDKKCVYLQGLANSSRAAYESVEAVLQTPNLSAVIVGGFDDESTNQLEKEHGADLNERVFFVGKIPQLKIPQYVEQCFMSLVFYKNVRPNNYYCEANRFYQSVILGLPVVVGNNPSMKELVDKYGFGVSIDDDGRDIEKIKNGIRIITDNYDSFIENITKNRSMLLWDTQDGEIKSIIDKLFL